MHIETLEVRVCERFATAAHRLLVEGGYSEEYLLAAFDIANDSAEPHQHALWALRPHDVFYAVRASMAQAIRIATGAGKDEHWVIDLFDAYCRDSGFVDELRGN